MASETYSVVITESITEHETGLRSTRSASYRIVVPQHGKGSYLPAIEATERALETFRDHGLASEGRYENPSVQVETKPWPA